jgi:hypothetical protein
MASVSALIACKTTKKLYFTFKLELDIKYRSYFFNKNINILLYFKKKQKAFLPDQFWACKEFTANVWREKLSIHNKKSAQPQPEKI